jgi:hypothetical protein
MQSGEALFEPFAKRLDAFTVNPPAPLLALTRSHAISKFFRL